MLTDIFAYRYADVPLWSEFGEHERRLLVQGYRILDEQMFPYFTDGKESPFGKAMWTDIQSRLSMELGLKSLSPLVYSYTSTWQGKPHPVTGFWTINKVCENWITQAVTTSPDVHMKERLSLIEIGFRIREEQVAAANRDLPRQLLEASAIVSSPSRRGTFRLPGDRAKGLRALNEKINREFRAHVDELNVRLRQSGSGLHYHNGFIQRSEDARITEQVESPFWNAVGDPKWQNVDVDMKEALDRRDTGGRDPAFYAARALESTIKIISAEKQWTHGRERGAHNFIDNLSSQNANFILDWEAETLKHFFSKLRNPLGHGPGSEAMPALSGPQTDWAIEFCMSWIKSLIRRM